MEDVGYGTDEDVVVDLHASEEMEQTQDYLDTNDMTMQGNEVFIFFCYFRSV
jgi:hypothetical protein